MLLLWQTLLVLIIHVLEQTKRHRVSEEKGLLELEWVPIEHQGRWKKGFGLGFVAGILETRWLGIFVGVERLCKNALEGCLKLAEFGLIA